MARYTHVYGEFVERLREIDILRVRAARLERSRQSYKYSQEIAALCRGGVVLLSSHIEAYVKELGEHAIDTMFQKGVCRSQLAPQFFYYVSRKKLEQIGASEDPAVVAQNVFKFISEHGHYWEATDPFRLPVLAQEFNSGFSNPAFKKVKSYLGRFGYSTFTADFDKYLTRDSRSTKDGLNQIVDARNAIAHGESSANKTPAELKYMMNTAKVFCRTTDTLFANWCSRQLCAVR